MGKWATLVFGEPEWELLQPHTMAYVLLLQSGAEDANPGWVRDSTTSSPNPSLCLPVSGLRICKWIPTPGPAHTAQSSGSLSGPVLPTVVPKPLCSAAVPSRGPESAKELPTGNCRQCGLLGLRSF